MSIAQRCGALVIAMFAVVFRHAPWLIRWSNPLLIRLLGTRMPLGPNVLLTVRGRSSGLPRSVPVAMLDAGDRCFLQAASDEVAWVRNLLVAGEASITSRGRVETLVAAPLAPEDAGRVIHAQLERFPRSRLVRSVVGPVDRPPVGVLHYFRIRVDDTLEECIATARRFPLFELRR